MLYVILNANGIARVATTEYTTQGSLNAKVETRHDWKTMERAEEVAAQLTAASKSGKKFMATDSGAGVSPRYDVIEAPQVGQPVSGYFNGDSYPEGEIVKISATMKRIETSTGAVFSRRKQSGSWVKNGTWSMIQGHVSERNPSF